MEVNTRVRVVIGSELGEGRVIGIRALGGEDSVIVAFPPCECGQPDCPYGNRIEVLGFNPSEVFPLETN